jgi:UDP-GlcNAc:undecaprenyl-phosphate/decaprenyl-phosphate GlcNAc-1-phosphate transferase
MSFAGLTVLVFVATLLGSLLLVPVARLAAVRLGVLDHPGGRKIHGGPMPRMGGVAVFASFTAVVLAGFLSRTSAADVHWLRALLGESLAPLQDAHLVKGRLLAVLGGAGLCFAVGLLDDVLGNRFPLLLKAAGQSVAAVLVIVAGVRTDLLPVEGLNVVLTFLWLVGITNAFNLLDNMDGLSAGVAFVASLVLLLNAWSLGEHLISLLIVAFMGSLLGFLFFNFQPASVFLGDCGSLFIGFTMASLALLERYVSHASSTLFPTVMPVVVLAVPLIDTLSVIAIRLREGRPVYVGDRRHLSHRLVAHGFSQREAVLFLYLTTFSLGLGAASLSDATPWQTALVLLQTLGFGLLLLWVLRRRPAEQPQ